MLQSKMNYFELFQMPVSFDIDLDKLRRDYLEAQRLVHPDKVHGDTSQSAKLNIAYATLSNDDSRAKHIFELNGIDLKQNKIDIDKLNYARNNPSICKERMLDAFRGGDIQSAYEYWSLCRYVRS